MNDFLLKYNRLNSLSQKQLLDFLDFLLGKQERKGNTFDHQAYRSKLSRVTVWSDSDLEEIENTTNQSGWEIGRW